MKNNIIYLLFLFLSVPVFAQKNQHVVYGEKEKYYKPEKNVLGLFIDRKGHFYPKDFITNENLYKNNASLQEFYANNPKRFLVVAKKYQLEFDKYSIPNFILLQDAIILEKINEINEFSKNKKLFILIHGFRKSFIKKSRSTTAIEDFGYLRNGIQKYIDEEKTPNYLEIYWDGMYDSFFGKNSGSLEEIFKLFENQAQQNATKTGYALRKIISKINKKELNIITHSLGAQVCISLLTNTYISRLENKNSTKLKTPSQAKINICLIAPAMAAAPFEDYHKRTTKLNFKKKDNYFLSILFNENDLVLNKKIGFFGPGPKKYGDTSLGCNYENEIGVLENIFKSKFKNANLKIYDTTVTKDHRIKEYVKTLNFEKVLLTLLN